MNVIEEIAEDGPNTSTITYLPPCDECQRSLCQRLGMTFIRVLLTFFKYGISHQPAATVRTQGDCNCFFRALAFVIIGSKMNTQNSELLQHHTCRTMLKICHATLMLMKQWTSIQQEQTCTIATEVENFAVSNMLWTPIMVFCHSGHSYKWLHFLPHPCEESNVVHAHSKEAVYLVNTRDHYEPVRRM